MHRDEEKENNLFIIKMYILGGTVGGNLRFSTVNTSSHFCSRQEGSRRRSRHVEFLAGYRCTLVPRLPFPVVVTSQSSHWILLRNKFVILLL